jgi:hypothetical protein
MPRQHSPESTDALDLRRDPARPGIAGALAYLDDVVPSVTTHQRIQAAITHAGFDRVLRGATLSKGNDTNQARLETRLGPLAYRHSRLGAGALRCQPNDL